MTDKKLLHCFKFTSKTAMGIIAHEKFNFPTTIQPRNFDLSLYKIINLHKEVSFLKKFKENIIVISCSCHIC